MSSLNINNISAIIFDFDGVLTDNRVLLDATGGEWVRCCRSDGLAFDALRQANCQLFIVSTEKNKVVSARAKKIQVPVVQGVRDKPSTIKEISAEYCFDLKDTIYVGNDLNDYRAMEMCGYGICPTDSHVRIRALADVVLNSKGGEGVVRELVENVLQMDVLEILYPECT